MRLIFTVFYLFLFTHTHSQVSVNNAIHGSDKSIISNKQIISGTEALSHLLISTNPYVSSARTNSMNETLLGNTTYDLQSNGAVMDRIIRHNGGELSAVWTMSSQYAAAFTDRGSGYVFFDGTSWSSAPTTRIESSRCGWPTILSTNSGKEIVVAHNTDNSYFQMTSRSTIGSGTWDEQIISSQDSTTGVYRDLVWNRTTVGGSNGETLHMIGVTSPSGLTGTLYNGLDGALLYYRSTDGGTTWDIKDKQLPTLDSSNFIGFGGDSYAIDSKGETVVVAIFNDWADSFILKSSDNGVTWTRTTFIDFPIDKYTIDSGLDLDSNGTFDQVYSTDNYGTVILDNNDKAHVFFGNMRYLDDDLADGVSSWFPLTNGLIYWNEDMGSDTTLPTPQDTDIWYSEMPVVIAQARDLDCNDQVAGYDSTGTWAAYYSSLSSMPSVAITNNGDLYVTFSAYTENIDNSEQVFRHINIIRSLDGGATWSEPIDITPHDMWNGQQECVFASMVKNISDDKIQLIYQKDFEPGLAVRGDEDLIDINEIIYLDFEINSQKWCDLYGCTDPTATNYDPNADCDNGCCIGGTSSVGSFISNKDLFEMTPNPTTSNVNIEFSTNTKSKVEIFDLLGKKCFFNNYVSNQSISIDLSKFESGTYFVKVYNDNNIDSKKLIIK